MGRLADGRSRGLRLLDMGTGSGCLLLACLSELPSATGLGLDINPDAIDMARHNARALGFAKRATFAVADFTGSMEWLGYFDIILSNPPYIPSAQIATLSSEVAVYDPLLALDGGHDGLDCLRCLIPKMAKLLSERGQIFVEIGDGQGADVTAFATAAGLSSVGIFADLSGKERCLVFSGGSDHEITAKMPDPLQILLVIRHDERLMLKMLFVKFARIGASAVSQKSGTTNRVQGICLLQALACGPIMITGSKIYETTSEC